MEGKGCRSEITLISVIVLLSYRLFGSEEDGGKGISISFPLHHLLFTSTLVLLTSPLSLADVLSQDSGIQANACFLSSIAYKKQLQTATLEETQDEVDTRKNAE